jgi:hypothetical protein
MRIHTFIRPLLTAVLMTTALGLAACGSEPGSDPAANREEKMQDAALKFARCMRENGIDMPDPQPGQRGIRIEQPKGVSPQKMEAADKACRKYLEAVKPPELSEEQQKEFKDAALAHAKCMRDHGIDFPDPTFDENGGAQVRIGPGSGIDPDSPKFQAAQKECESKMPQLGGDPDGGPSTDEDSQ